MIGDVFEDFLTQSLEPDGRNIVENYLKRRSWKESAGNRRYIEALRGSCMSLYEVSERICRKLEVEAFLSAILWRDQGAKSLIF